jgi:hypothetical protein
MTSVLSEHVTATVGQLPAMHIDESGNTGEHLTAPEQPVIGVQRRA